MFLVRRVMVFAVLSFAAASPAAPASAATIVKVLPFTPTADSVRIQTVLSDDAAGAANLSGVITPAGEKTAVWRGTLQPETVLEKLKVKPWSPGSPSLYELTVSGTAGGQQLKPFTVRFGFRQVQSRNGNVYLNGKPIFLRGLAINPPGRTVPKAVGASRQFAYDYVRYLRGQHVNLIRMTEPDPDWFDVCDELGMLVYQGIYRSPPSGLSKEEEEAQKLEDQDEATGKKLPKDFEKSMAAYVKEFEAYAAHPSVIIYILSNEMPYKGATGQEVHKFLTAAHGHLKKWDSTRLYIGNAGYGEGRQGDINDVHRYWGWYYNTFLTYFNLRDPRMFGEYEKEQPFTFSECVGNFTGPDGAYNNIERKQLAAALGWTGTAEDQPKEAQAYQAFMTKQATELFRRLRPINPRLSGLMPFTITFHHWRGIENFQQMKPTAAAKQFGISYQPVLLSWELWQTQVYAGSKITPVAHVINDAEDFSDLAAARLTWELKRGNETRAKGEAAIPTVPYYGTWKTPIEIALPANLSTGDYSLVGTITKNGKSVSVNDQPIFIAGADWKTPIATKRKIALHDPAGKTRAALAKLGVNTRAVDWSDPADTLVVIAEQGWDNSLSANLRKFVAAGGRTLVLGQTHDKMDVAALPNAIEMNQRSANDPEYMTADRPAFEMMHVNPERPDHPVFRGITRDHLKLWSDYSNWTQDKPGFPRVYPVAYGFKLTRKTDLSNVAVLADYDRGLEGMALVELFDGDGSLLLCAFDLIPRVGLDPVADRMLGNLLSYMSGSEPHAKHPLVDQPIQWGNYVTQRGVIPGPMYGLFINADWKRPPTDPAAKPLLDKDGAWNTKPGDQFVPRGVRPRGPFYYTFNCGVRESQAKSATGSGQFFATIPAGRKMVVTKVKNPTAGPASLRVDVNGVEGKPVDVPRDTETIIRTPINDGATDVGVRYTGEKELIILETSFQ